MIERRALLMAQSGQRSSDISDIKALANGIYLVINDYEVIDVNDFDASFHDAKYVLIKVNSNNIWVTDLKFYPASNLSGLQTGTMYFRYEKYGKDALNKKVLDYIQNNSDLFNTAAFHLFNDNYNGLWSGYTGDKYATMAVKYPEILNDSTNYKFNKYFLINGQTSSSTSTSAGNASLSNTALFVGANLASSL